MALQGGPCHASVQESFYYLGPHHPLLQRQQACLREVVQFPLVALVQVVVDIEVIMENDL